MANGNSSYLGWPVFSRLSNCRFTFPQTKSDVWTNFPLVLLRTQTMRECDNLNSSPIRSDYRPEAPRDSAGILSS